MQHISTNIHVPKPYYSGGGRISSPKLRASLEQSEDFLGLEEDTNRYDLLLLVKRVGKSAGFTSRMIELLDYYMAFTRDIDWQEGHSPLVYQSLSKTALDLDVSERQIQKLEKALFEVGALTWHDSGNHRRYGQRCEDTGEILYAYGVDLTPLAYLKETLEQQLAKKKAEKAAWMENKRQISWYRRQIRAMMAELEGSDAAQASFFIDIEKKYDDIAKPIRTHMDNERLKALIAEHKDLYEVVLKNLEKGQKIQKRPENELNKPKMTQKSSCKDEQEFVHYKSTTQEPFNKLNTSRDKPTGFQERRNGNSGKYSSSIEKIDKLVEKGRQASQPQDNDPEDMILKTGLQHITLKQALNVASSDFKAHMPLEPRAMNWHDFVEAAYKLRGHLSISQNSWSHACVTLGRTGAAMCVLLTEAGTHRTDDPVTKPAGYFNAMINRAKRGELHLHKSVFGILKREQGDET